MHLYLSDYEHSHIHTCLHIKYVYLSAVIYVHATFVGGVLAIESCFAAWLVINSGMAAVEGQCDLPLNQLVQPKWKNLQKNKIYKT